MGSLADTAVALLLAALLIVGGYQVYFLPQRHPLRGPRSLLLSLDEKIPFRPGWVWIYSFLYYPFIVSTILTIRDFKQFAYTCLNFMALLVLQVVIAFVFPVKTPPSWRAYDPTISPSARFLGFVHSVDKGGNCFPSMHIAVATLSALHSASNLYPHIGAAAYCLVLLPLLIAVSTLFTKQHYLLDLPAGAALAYAVFSLHHLLYA
jgi:membrane-associated phospholipid phosphatase